TAGAAQSWQMDNRSKTMLLNKFNFGFADKWMCKDLKICLEESKNNGSKLPVAKKILSFYEEIRKNNNGEMDTSCLIKRL
ncbi:MAG: NAD-binding protein, partial [Alphaproteobacteria bacterium]|nr:NAD-binding protein [Alphaproteobacteria bacterium]